jgi:hypothetical protein
MWSRKVADSTMVASTCHAAGFLRLFLLHKLMAWDGHYFSFETGSNVLLSEKLKLNLNPKFLAEPDVGVPLPAAAVLKRSSFTDGESPLVASGAPADAPFRDRIAGSQSHLFFALVVSAQPRPFLWILSLGPCKERIPAAGRDRRS